MASTTIFKNPEQGYARELDAQDPLRELRQEFLIPSKADLKRRTLRREETNGATIPSSNDSCIYLCGNSLGLQPRHTSANIKAHLETWATKAVHGHFTQLEDSPLAPWRDLDEAVAPGMGELVGAKAEEIAVMQTLTANLHIAMASFYTPTPQRWKIILERRAFPSDHYAIESQIVHHGLDPAKAMIQMKPNDETKAVLTTTEVLANIDAHAEDTALILLPGIQYYTGQCFDIAAITAHAHSRGIVVGWDLAHAAGNVHLELHNWNVDFAVWCNYKYLNCGPGAIGSLFIHERHGALNMEGQDNSVPFRPRLTGWWGGDKSVRFRMDNNFIPIPGAAGYQLSNPSALDLAVVSASLDIFKKAGGMPALRRKSESLTGYLEYLIHAEGLGDLGVTIVTPADPAQRGAQLSLRLSPSGRLQGVMEALDGAGVVVDERKPDVIRVAPAPLYNSFEDVWLFVSILKAALGGS